MAVLLKQAFAGRNILYANYEAWLQDRVFHGHTSEDPGRYRIGGSMAASILGVGWGSPWSVYREYVDGVGQTLSPSEVEDCLRGKRMEKVVGDLWQSMTGYDLHRCSVRVLHSSHTWASVSPDGFVELEGDLVGVEIKTSREPWKWGLTGQVIEEWREGHSNHIIPGRVAAQVYWSMAVTGLKEWIVVVAIPGLAEFLDVREYVVKADPAVQIAMLRRISHWRERHLLQKVEPPMDGSRACRDALSDRFGELKSPVRRAEGEEADMIRRYAAINAEIKELTRQKAKLRNEIVAAIADGKGLTLSSGGKAILGRPKNRTPMLRVSGVKHDG